MKSKLPQSVKICLWSYDTDKMSISKNRHRIILNVLNYGREEAIEWVQANYTEKQIKEVIKKSYASEWFKWRLKHWIDFYKVSPKWKTRIEYIMSKEESDFKLPPSFNELWPYGGHTL